MTSKTSRRLRRVVLRATTGLAAISGLVLVVWWALTPASVPVPPRGGLGLRNVTLINPGRDRAAGRTLLVEGGRITTIRLTAPADAPAPGLASAEGGFVLPGLIGMHVHLPPALAIGNQQLFGLLFLAHGITTVRDMGTSDGTAFDVQAKFREGRAPGPRVVAAGRLLDGDPPIWRSARMVRSPKEADAAVAEQVGAGAALIKVYSNLDPASLRAVCAAAARKGLRVVGHVPFEVPLEESGISDVQHFEDVVMFPRPHSFSECGLSQFLDRYILWS